MAGVLALPLFGGLAANASANETVGAHAPAAPELSAEMQLWDYLDHSSSWAETVEHLRRYIADGHPDAEVYQAVAESLERHVTDDEPEGVLGLYPSTVLMLSSLQHLRRYGASGDLAAQRKLIEKLMGDA